MSTSDTVYVFTCGHSTIFGFSIQQDGANLPTAVGSTERWKLAFKVAMEERALETFRVDPAIALANLHACGYHIGTRAEPNTYSEEAA